MLSHDNLTPKIQIIFNKSLDTSESSSGESEVFGTDSKNAKRLQYDETLKQTIGGEVCSKYLPISASSVLRHPYYNYPGVVDPGIKEALLLPEPRAIFPDDGQELYLTLCKEARLSPIQIFYKELLQEKVNLRYYGINPMGFRTIAISLKNNKYVKTLDLTDNWISEDGCFHLSEMLIENINLKELNLYGCRIGPDGAKRLFANLHINHTLREIDLTKNYIGDIGVGHLAKAIFLGSDMTKINLSYNNLTATAVTLLADAFETHNKLTHLDLSWNTILSPNAVFRLCSRLSENTSLEELNLAWTSISGLRAGKAIKILLTNSHIKYLNLSNNKLSTVAIKQITDGLEGSRSLKILDLSYNLLTPKDALMLLSCLKERKVKLQKLLLDNVFVTAEFLELTREIMSLKYRKNAIITWGGLIPKFIPTVGDMRDIVLNRADAICKNSKKAVDIALVILELYKLRKEAMDIKEFSRALKSNGVIFDEGLLEEFSNSFNGPAGTAKIISLVDLVDYLKRKWPDRQLPSSPPPDTESKNKKQAYKKTK